MEVAILENDSYLFSTIFFATIADSPQFLGYTQPSHINTTKNIYIAIVMDCKLYIFADLSALKFHTGGKPNFSEICTKAAEAQIITFTQKLRARTCFTHYSRALPLQTTWRIMVEKVWTCEIVKQYVEVIIALKVFQSMQSLFCMLFVFIDCTCSALVTINLLV